MRRLAGWIVAVLLAVLAAATVSWSEGATLRLVDEAGAPASGAYVRFHYKGHLVNPVHPVGYIARGSVIVRAGADGVVRIPGRLHVRAPLPPSTPPKLFIDHVYVPRLHNAFGPVAEGTMSRPGVFAVDERRERLTVADVSDDPDRWAFGLAELFWNIRETFPRDPPGASADPGDGATLAHAREMIGHLRAEHAAFLARHGQTVRARPPEPVGASARDLDAWRARTDEMLAREPRWGPYFERMWRSNLEELDALAPDPVNGIWVLNLAKSTFRPGPAPRAETRVYDMAAPHLIITSTVVDADGTQRTVRSTYVVDGQAHPVEAPDGDSQVLTQIDRLTVEVRMMKDGEVVRTARRTVSNDGQVLTITMRGRDGAGQAFDNVAVYDRR